MKRLLTIGAVTAASLSLGGTALAGEITGNGQPTPINEYRAGSICSFSGLDDMDFEAPVQPGTTQTWGGALLSETSGEGQPTVAEAATSGILQSFGPGSSCRGYASDG